VTSRSALAGLAAAEGAHPLRLGPLDDEQSVRLLAARLGPQRVAAESEAAAELAARCGHLPLALAVMAARAAADPGLSLGVLAAQLAGAAGGEGPGRLEVLETGDPATSLGELLSWSYRQLSPPAAAVFALLGVHCGPDITVPAAASLAGVPPADARRALAELAGASLAAEHRPGRYVLHDLVRGYAAMLAQQTISEAGIREATCRSLDHYLHTMVTSYDPFPPPYTAAPPAPGVTSEQLAGEAGLVDWAQAEHQVLLQAATQAAAAGFITHAWQIFECLSWFLGDRGYWADCQAVGQAVQAAAQAAGDHTGLGWTHVIIGGYCMFTGAHDQGRAHQQQALDHFGRAGDLPGRAWAHLYAGLASSYKGSDWAEGAAHAGQALALFRQAGDPYGQRWALHALGEYHAHLGNYELARGYARQALQLGPEAGDPTMTALAWSVLGLVHSRLGEHPHALTCYQQALTLAHAWKTPLARRWLATILAGSGDARQAAGDLAGAARAWQQALQILHDLGLPENPPIRARLDQVGPPRPPG
jgi:tetratricopeptide (TPR) repeat protein